MSTALAQTFPAVVKPHPLTSDTSVAYMREGMTLRDVIGPDATDSLRIEVGGVDVPAHMWDKVRPRAGTPVHVTVVPQGGNGGKWLRVVLLIIIAVVTYGIGGYAGLAASAASTFGGTAAVWAAGIMLVGTLAVTPLIPPPEMKP